MNTRFIGLFRPRTCLIFALTLAGCPASNGEPKDASDAAGEKRDTELTHEDCDVSSSSAVKLDGNGDKRPDIITVMDGKRPECRAADINMDGVIDVFIYYDDAGKMRRRESGFDRDSRPDEISHYAAGVIVRKERETNNDAKIDTWDYFEGGKLAREERDSTGDGYVDQWWTFPSDDLKCAVVVSDGDGDGKPDPDSQIDLCKDAKPAPPPSADDKKEGEDGDDKDTNEPDAAPDAAKDDGAAKDGDGQ
jgi:hypothetical protein